MCPQIGQAIEEVNTNNQELLRKYRRELQLRKKCHNELVRLKGDEWGQGGHQLSSCSGGRALPPRSHHRWKHRKGRELAPSPRAGKLAILDLNLELPSMPMAGRSQLCVAEVWGNGLDATCSDLGLVSLETLQFNASSSCSGPGAGPDTGHWAVAPQIPF